MDKIYALYITLVFPSAQNSTLVSSFWLYEWLYEYWVKYISTYLFYKEEIIL